MRPIIICNIIYRCSYRACENCGKEHRTQKTKGKEALKKLCIFFSVFNSLLKNFEMDRRFPSPSEKEIPNHDEIGLIITEISYFFHSFQGIHSPVEKKQWISAEKAEVLPEVIDAAPERD
jgi:hypothetical protein